MRGQRVFNELIKDSGLNANLTKGRSSNLIIRRNECLAARYFFYGYFRNLCYEEILRALVSEFFLSAHTISNIIMEQADNIGALKQKSPSMHYFQNRWPHMKW